MMKRRLMRGAAASMSAVLLAGMLPITSFAAVEFGWEEEDGKTYWYEDGVKQGTEGRGKEIYDPGTEAWYWLDAPDGVKAVSKDVYQESEAGQWGDYIVDGIRYGKWVRYDENGRMIKGWSTTDAGTYYFDETYGTMAKGYATVDGTEYYFNTETGVKERELGAVPEGNGWKTIDGEDFWYENGVRQGYSVDASYRGKEIYDPGSDAWYWLDNVDGGKKAVSKDVYQESQADDQGTIGKWVRYDENGHMIKGWDTNENGTYYFDPIYGTMIKGYATIDGKTYYFDPDTGILQSEVTETTYYVWMSQKNATYNDDGTIRSYTVYERNDNGDITKYTSYVGNKSNQETGNYYGENENDVHISYQRETVYDDQGLTKQTRYLSYSYVVSSGTSYLSSEEVSDYNAGILDESVYKYYNSDGTLRSKSVSKYNENGEPVRDEDYNGNDVLTAYRVYTYNADGDLEKRENFSGDGNLVSTVYYYYNDKAQLIYSEQKSGETVEFRTEYSYTDEGLMKEEVHYYRSSSYVNGTLTYELKKNYRYTYEYDSNGNELQSFNYSYDSDGTETLTGKTEYTYEDYNGRTYTHTYDSWRRRSVYDSASGAYQYKLGYSNGYEYIREDGVLVKYISYTSNENYDKTMSSYTEYQTITLPSDAQVGDVFRVNPYSVTYDADGNRLYYQVIEYVKVQRTRVG